MNVIWKYPLSLTGTNILRMPEGAKVIHLGSQDNQLILWAIVDEESPLETRQFNIYGTGQPMTSEVEQYLGTVQIDSLVWHVFRADY